jgi:predicted XRE-type DNA-binding protein
MGKLDHVKDKVVKMIAVGEPQTEIAEQVGVNQSTISRFANEEEASSEFEEKEEVVNNKYCNTCSFFKDS